MHYGCKMTDNAGEASNWVVNIDSDDSTSSTSVVTFVDEPILDADSDFSFVPEDDQASNTNASSIVESLNESIGDLDSEFNPVEVWNDSSNTGTDGMESVGVSEGFGTITTSEDSRGSSMRPEEAEEREEAGDEGSEPPAKLMKLSQPEETNAAEGGAEEEEDDGDGATCPICLEIWSNTGEHRLVSLKCGHLFGLSCVQRWLRGRSAAERACPTCKARAALRDVRRVYARRLLAADAGELSALRRRVDELTEERGRMRVELAAERHERRALAAALERLRAAGAAAPAPAGRSESEARARGWRFALERNLEVCREGGCRVAAFNCRTHEFYVSQRSASPLFPGYGVRAVACADDYRPGSFLHLHPKPIRDLAYSQAADMLASVALDGGVRLTGRGAGAAGGAAVRARVPLWSCAWDARRAHVLHVGGVGGAVLQYDVRAPAAPLATLGSPGDLSPCVSLRSTEFGLLACQLTSCWLWRGAEAQALPVRGPFASLCYDAEAQRVLVSCRPTAAAGSAGRARLALYRVRREGDAVVFDAEQSALGSQRSSVLSRAAWVRCGEEAAWAAAYSESEAALVLHGVARARTLSLLASEPVLDVCAGRVNGATVLAALSDARVRLYRAHPAPA